MIGGYLASRTWSGAGSPGGGLFGVEAPLLSERLTLTADCLLGTNRESVEVVGFDIKPAEDSEWQISIGAQIPGPLAPDTNFAVVFGVTHEAEDEEK